MNSSKQEYHLLPVVTLLLAATLWGVVWYPLRLLEEQGMSGAWSALISYAAAMGVFVWVFYRDWQALRRNFLSLALMSLAAGWCNLAFIMAVLDGNVVRVLLLFYLSPFWAVCLGWLMLGERLDGKSMLVFVIAVVGALIMLWNEDIGMPWPRDQADWLAVSSGFGFALSNVFVRRMQAVTVQLKSASSWAGVVLIALVWLTIDGAGFPDVGAVTILMTVLLGLCGFLVMTLLVLYGVTHMPVHRSAVILLFELVAGAISSILLTDEVVLLREWIGGFMIVTAASLAARIHAGEAGD
jgi:drug/metabolite transporter (DMT)-like permease